MLPGRLYVERLQLLCRHDRLIRFLEARFEHALLDISQYGETSLGIVEHVPRFAAASLHRFHVVLDADNGIGKTIGFFLRQANRTACTQHRGDQASDAIDDLHGTCLVQHEQAGFDAVDQHRNAVEPGGRRFRRDALANGFLDARQVNNALAHHRLRNLAEILIVLRRILRRVSRGGQREADQLLLQPVFDSQ